MKPPLFYVGIGASAGGQEALCEFFTHLPPDTNAAYFVITHLARHHKSRLFEIIGRHTTMTVVPVDIPMKVRPGSVYFLVENTIMLFDKEGLVVKQRIDSETINRAVDVFFLSLAKQHKKQAVGIILSGGGKDGAEGAIEIRKFGGKVLVQDPGSSLFDGMPNATIKKDHPVAVLTPAALAVRIAEMLKSTL